MKKILFTGGGSAGHVVPNVALIKELLKTGEADITYMGTDGIEKSIITSLGIPYYTISCPKLIRGGIKTFIKNLQIPAQLKQAKKQAVDGLKIIKPDLVFSKGGYVALPVVLAAATLKIPCLTHESDFSVGLANKLIAGKCERVLTAFPETATKFKNGKYCGAPIRKELFYADKKSAKKHFALTNGRKVLLIFGGGSGSEKINDAIRRYIVDLTDEFNVLHVCGKGKTIDCNIDGYTQFEYLDEMKYAYAAADIIVARAGAGTIFEVLALKKPAIFIPLESQTRGDQLENARYFEQKGLCTVLREAALDELVYTVKQTLNDTALRTTLSLNNLSNGTDNALHEIRRILRR